MTNTTPANATLYVDAEHSDEGTRVRVLSTTPETSLVWDGTSFETIPNNRIRPDGNHMNEMTITAKVLRPGDTITEGTLPAGTITKVEVDKWSVNVTYTNGREAYTSVIAILRILRAE